MCNIMSGFYYAVAKGRKPGIYQTWDECKRQVHQFSGPVYKKFSTSKEAQEFIGRHQSSPKNSSHGNASFSSIGRRNGSGGPPSSKADSVRSRATPEDVPRRAANATKRVRDSIDDEPNENETVVGAKRKKTVTNGGGGSGAKNLKKHFDMDPDGFVNVYTDGACSSNGRRGAKAGVGVYFGDDSPLNVSEPVVGRSTNNMAEIQAVTRAAERARETGISKIRIHTDSEFLIKCVTQWLPGWKRRGWMTAAGKPVVNRQELEEMESAIGSLTVQWNHVRGHRGIYGNEMADKLAREGAERYQKSS